jgi:hypothetical protein
MYVTFGRAVPLLALANKCPVLIGNELIAFTYGSNSTMNALQQSEIEIDTIAETDMTVW